MPKKEIRPYVIFFKPDTGLAAFRVFTSDDQVQLWVPAGKDPDCLLTMKTRGQTVFCARHADICAIHDVKNEVLHIPDWETFRVEKLGEQEGTPKKPIYGADGEKLN